MRFELVITLGNAAMKTPEHVASALCDAAEAVLERGLSNGRIRDLNGNTVGYWAVEA